MKKNLFSMASAEMIVRILAFLLTIVIARSFGAGVFGQLAIAQLIGTYISILVIYGLNTIGIKELAKNTAALSMITSIHKIRFLLFLVVNVSSILFYFVAPIDADLRLLVVLYIFASSLLAVTDMSWIFNGFSMMKFTSWVRVFQQVVYVGFAALFLSFTTLDMFALPVAMVLSSFATGAFSILLLKRSKLISGLDLTGIRTYFTFTSTEIKLVKTSSKIFLSAILVQIYTSSAALIISHFHSSEVVGLFNANLRITTLLLTIPSIIITVLFPLLSGAVAEKRKQLFNSSLKTMCIIVFPISIGGAITSYGLIHLLFGEEFVAASTSFKILIAGISVSFINYVLGYMLISSDSEKMFLRMVSIAAVVNMTLNLIFIPRYGITAAAATTVLAELIIMVGYAYKINKMNAFSIERSWLARTVAVMLIFTAVVFLLYTYTNIIVTLFLSALSYGFLVFAFKLVALRGRGSNEQVHQAKALS